MLDVLRRLTAPLALASLLMSGPVSAGSYSAIYAFGDSLSDVGNLSATIGAPVAPYANGQFSNGDVWLQTLARQSGVAPLKASLAGGTNYAYGGAQTGSTAFHTATFTDLWGPGGQVDQFRAFHASADADALYTLWIGGNDVRNAPLNASPSTLAASFARSVGNIGLAIDSLAKLGARNFLVLTLPNLGLTPEVRSLGAGASQLAAHAAASFNNLLVNGSSTLGVGSLADAAQSHGVSIKVLDTFALNTAVFANPAAYGFDNVTDPCFTGTIYGGPFSGSLCGSTASAQNRYFYWDSVHPTAAAHALVGEAALTAVPETQRLVLLVLGLLALGTQVQRRRR